MHKEHIRITSPPQRQGMSGSDRNHVNSGMEARLEISENGVQ
jgi:hypothetical protein